MVWSSGMASLHKSKGEGRFFFPLRVLRLIKPLVLITRQLREQSTLGLIVTALSLLSTPKRHRIQEMIGSSKDQPIPSPGPLSSVMLHPPLWPHV